MRTCFGISVALLSAVVGTGAIFGADGTMGVPAVQERPPVNARVALIVPVKELKVDGAGLAHVMDYFRNISGANIFVNWKVLEAAGVNKDTPVTLQVRDLPLKKMMELALTQAAPNAQLVISVDQNVIEITTLEAADTVLVTRIYDVNEIVLPTQNDVNPPKIDISQASQSSSGGSSNLFSGSSTNQPSTDTKEKHGADLVATIEASVRPNIWKDNGGTASMRYVQGQLIVTAPESVQEAIAGVPASERVARAERRLSDAASK